MIRFPSKERPDWQQRASQFGFHFHTMYGQPYWDETNYYQFTLEQIEADLEAPSETIHQLCLQAVENVLNDDALLAKFQIPQPFWDWIKASWQNQEPCLYARLDLAYNGSGDAKLYENNADTPTSLYESGFWQWLWLEDKVNRGDIHRRADQFNSIQEKLVQRFARLHQDNLGEVLHFACCKDTEEDRGTVQYLQDCAEEAGIACKFVYIEDIGHGEGEVLTDLDDQVITWMFKLYPWEFMLREEYAPLLLTAKVKWLEPPWKAIISNKAILPVLWQMFPDHPNLLPAYFSEQDAKQHLSRYVKKPIFAREGANVSIYSNGEEIVHSDGPYGEEGFIYQAYYPMPKFGDDHTLIGSWLIDYQACGLSIREDKALITQDLSRFVPHIIVD
ncbi:glutathionylspermidine synthase family protein [Thalassotalea mangrovi]|uniref:Glutathionylspermidine synthase family protein n=1 Tax=Thalassotalea mangrovi TaxID=2572245 RepID=A0A4U1B3D9_9GAMM|nr:glutathionylspermidine synthase family protein [Thalassotalea mangrovi]TKB44208.1 glutathionylspermidine synthase family protein [Thalassotalea mangrovi]